MNEHIEEEGLKHLEQIEQELEEIKNRTPNRGKSFIYGLLQGAGILLGGIFALTLLGWVLSFFGLIPGFADIAHYFQNIVANFRR
jgi:ABC-type Fe3+-hydroxamate transport system substrate-binding protein